MSGEERDPHDWLIIGLATFVVIHSCLLIVLAVKWRQLNERFEVLERIVEAL